MPEYCFEKDFAPACNIDIIDMILEKNNYIARKNNTPRKNKTINEELETKYWKIPRPTNKFNFTKHNKNSNIIYNSTMIGHGCNNLKSLYICRDYDVVFQHTAKYRDKTEYDRKWDTFKYNRHHPFYEYKYASGWYYLKSRLPQYH